MPARTKNVDKGLATIPTAAGTNEMLAISPYAGNFAGARITFIDALAANDSNYVTFAIRNYGPAGVANTALLAATDANTTKATGGTALVAKGKRTLISHGTLTNLAIAAGDVLGIQVIASGTLANTLTGGFIQLLIDVSQ